MFAKQKLSTAALLENVAYDDDFHSSFLEYMIQPFHIGCTFPLAECTYRDHMVADICIFEAFLPKLFEDVHLDVLHAKNTKHIIYSFL